MVGGRPTSATIDLGAIRANFAEARRRADGRELMAVVKADAYGHGAVRVSQTLVEAGCRWFAVATVAEGVELRDAGICEPILVLGGVFDAEESEAAVGLDLTPAVFHPGHVALLTAAARDLPHPFDVHVAVDTGMRRTGIAREGAIALLEAVARAPALHLGGVYSHLARADEPDLAPSLDQVRALGELLERARERGLDPGLIHMVHSAGLLAGKALIEPLPEQGAARPGVMLYGVRPAPHFEVDLQPAMRLATRVVQLRSARAGDPVGYGAEFRAPRDTRIATLPIGYDDGVPISTSGRGCVLLAGRRMPIAGRISMDFITVDVGDAQVEIGDEAILFGGAQGDAVLKVEEAAAAAQTIPYELLVRVGRRVQRQFEA
ncbi:MAG: alanine racemase [Deltaproteobacteria bacterium]|nr:alanine racemase [Deltaproteobacteria bacterium]